MRVRSTTVMKTPFKHKWDLDAETEVKHFCSQSAVSIWQAPSHPKRWGLTPATLFITYLHGLKPILTWCTVMWFLTVTNALMVGCRVVVVVGAGEQPCSLSDSLLFGCTMVNERCILPYSVFQMHLPILWLGTCCGCTFSLIACLAGGFPATANAADTRKRPALYFLYMLGDRGDDDTSDPSCFKPSSDRATTVSVRVILHGLMANASVTEGVMTATPTICHSAASPKIS